MERKKNDLGGYKCLMESSHHCGKHDLHCVNCPDRPLRKNPMALPGQPPPAPSHLNYHQVVEQTHDQKRAMYMACEKENLCEMLIECNRHLSALTTPTKVYYPDGWQSCPHCNKTGIEPFSKVTDRINQPCTVCEGAKIISIATGKPPTSNTSL